MGRRLILGGLLVLAAAVALALVASPIDPVAFRPTPGPELTGVLAPNLALRRAELLGAGRLEGPEDVEQDDDGRLYAGLAGGTVARITPGEGEVRIESFVHTGGRPLGLDLDARGTLWVADAEMGLLSVDRRGRVASRVTEAGGEPLGFADDVDVAADGRVYVSDASRRFGPDELLLDVLEARSHGRLVEHDPGTGSTRVLLEGLHFANGVAVDPRGAFVLVAETFRYRVRRYWLAGTRAGEDEVFVDNLPGFPDGVSAAGPDRFWIALYALRDPRLDRHIHPRPWLKRLLAFLPQKLQSAPRPYGLVLAVDGSGRYLESLHDPGGERIRHVTSVEEREGSLLLGSVAAEAIGRYPLSLSGDAPGSARPPET